jgi:hypothetical protein
VVGKPGVKTPLGSQKRIWEGNFKIDRKKVALEHVGWINQAGDRDRCLAVVR